MDNVETCVVKQYIKRDNPWFVITLNEQLGLVQISSDFGTYSYRWSSPGPCLKTFLVGCDISYVINKFAHDNSGKDLSRYFDLDKTIDNMKKYILEETDFKEELSKEDREEEVSIFIDEQLFMYGNECDTANSFLAQARSSEDLMSALDSYDFDDLQEFMSIDYHPSLRMFMEKCWPRFIEELKDEMDTNYKLGLD